jgi:hypothetical protein
VVPFELIDKLKRVYLRKVGVEQHEIRLCGDSNGERVFAIGRPLDDVTVALENLPKTVGGGGIRIDNENHTPFGQGSPRIRIVAFFGGAYHPKVPTIPRFEGGICPAGVPKPGPRYLSDAVLAGLVEH